MEKEKVLSCITWIELILSLKKKHTLLQDKQMNTTITWRILVLDSSFHAAAMPTVCDESDEEKSCFSFNIFWKLESEIRTHGLAPDESSGVVLFNKGLHFRPDAQVGANPLHMARVTTAGPRHMQIMLTKQIQDLRLLSDFLVSYLIFLLTSFIYNNR